jgi:thioredoxin reductase (NADPH)
LARRVTGLREEGIERVLELSDGNEISSRAVLIATGAAYRRLGVPTLERFDGAGVFYTAGGDMRVMRGRDAVIVGGGNSAGQAAVHLAAVSRKVTLLVRSDTLDTMSDYLVREIERAPNIEVRRRTIVIGGEGDGSLERIVLRDEAHTSEERVEAQTVFVMIGAQPRTEWLAGCVERDRTGFVLTGTDLEGMRAQAPLRFETSLAGVFAAGDVRSASVKRVASAVGEGAMAIVSVHEYLGAIDQEQRRGRALAEAAHPH